MDKFKMVLKVGVMLLTPTFIVLGAIFVVWLLERRKLRLLQKGRPGKTTAELEKK